MGDAARNSQTTRFNGTLKLVLYLVGMTAAVVATFFILQGDVRELGARHDGDIQRLEEVNQGRFDAIMFQLSEIKSRLP